MRVVHGEVADDDGHGQGDGEHSGQRAQGSDEHAHVRLWRHVAVPDRGHGDQRPPKAQRYAVEVIVRVGLDALRVVHQAGEYDDAQHQEEHEQRQLLGRCPKRLHEDFQPGRVSRQLEQPHYPDNREKFEYVSVLQVRCKLLQDQVDVEAERGDVVDDVDGRLDELAFVGRRDEPHQDLEREPSVAHALDVKERLVRVRLRLVQHPCGRVVRRVHRYVFDDGHPHVRVRLQAERQDGHAYEENGHDADDLRTHAQGGRRSSSVRVGVLGT